MAKIQKSPYLGVFEGMDFPDYTYEHFPLIMTKFAVDEKGKRTIVDQKIANDAVAERLAQDEGYESPTRVGPPTGLTSTEVSVLQKERQEALDLAAAAKDVALKKDAELQELQKEVAALRAAQAAGGAPPAVKPPAAVKP